MTPLCPPADVLEAWLAGPAVDDALTTHVAGCPACQTRLDHLSDDPELRRWAGDGIDSACLPDPSIDAAVARLLERGPASGAGAAGGPTAIPLPDRIGPYRVEAELGRGGMGIVYRASDDALGRPVAVKLIRPDLFGPSARERFLREARAAARVRHDHVVSVHAVGETADGTPYLAMEYLAGPTLAKLIRDRGRLEPREAAALAAQVADGLAAAHAAGLVHRDVKPANILFDPETGRAKLADFGLARADVGSATVTAESAIAGTPAYLSPEQARGEVVDGRCDVYGLGMTLYEMLVGEVPFRGAAHLVLRQVLMDDPRPPRQLNDAIPRDLETVALKALAKEPERRYGSATEFAADLRRYYRNEPVRARPAGRLERAARWCRRNPRVAVLTLTVAGLSFLIVVGSVTAAVLIGQAYGRAETDRLAAVAAGERAEASAKAAAADFELALDGYNTLIQKVQTQIKSQPGLLPLRRALLETAADGLKRIVRVPDATARVDRLMVVAHDRLADLYMTLGRTPEARREYEAEMQLAESVAASLPESRDARRAVANAHDKLGTLASNSADVPTLTDHYTRAFEIRRELVEQYPRDRALQRELSISYHKLGDASMTAGDPATARKRYDESLRLIEVLPLTEDPAERPIDLRFRHTRLAVACLALGDVDAADRHAQAALGNARILAQQDPVTGRHELAASLEQAAQVSIRRLDPKSAVGHRTEVVSLRRAAFAADPESGEAKRNLGAALYLLGDASAAAGDLRATGLAYAEHLKLCEEAVAADPGSLQKAGDRVVAYERQMLLAEAERRYSDAAGWAAKLADLCRRAETMPQLAYLQPGFWRARRELDQAVYEAADKVGLDDPAAFTSMPPPVCLGLLRLRALELGAQGKGAAAADLQTAGGSTAEMQFSAGRAFALAARKADADREHYVAAALAALREAIRLDPTVALGLVAYPELVALRDRPNFRELLRPAAAPVNRPTP